MCFSFHSIIIIEFVRAVHQVPLTNSKHVRSIITVFASSLHWRLHRWRRQPANILHSLSRNIWIWSRIYSLFLVLRTRYPILCTSAPNIYYCYCYYYCYYFVIFNRFDRFFTRKWFLNRCSTPKREFISIAFNKVWPRSSSANSSGTHTHSKWTQFRDTNDCRVQKQLSSIYCYVRSTKPLQTTY